MNSGRGGSPGSRSIQWDSKADLPGVYGTEYRVKVVAAAEGQPGPGPDIVWVDIPASNADYPAEDYPDGIGFTGEMSKYPTTNAQYTQYLNEALASGDIEVDGNKKQILFRPARALHTSPG